MLEGSVRKGGSRLRITAQLIEAETGSHLWAEKFDGALDDVFALQDQITERIVGVIEPSVLKSEIERARRKPPENLAAYDLYLRALPHLTSITLADGRKAAALLEDALRLDPGFPAAHARLAHCCEIVFSYGGMNPADQAAGVAHAEAVVASNTDDANALATAGFVLWNLALDYRRSIAAIERALAQNPNCVTALIWGAFVYSCGGDPSRAGPLAERALRLSPFDPMAWLAHLCLGHVGFSEDRYDDAVSHSARSVRLNPQFGANHAVYAAGLAMAGRIDEARQAALKAVELDPNFRVEVITRRFAKAFADKWATGARLAGLPE